MICGGTIVTAATKRKGWLSIANNTVGVSIASGKDTLKLDQDKPLKSIFFLLVILLIILLPLSVACVGVPTTARVIEVIDGDTIVIEGGYRVRYIGIDTPEKGEPYYSEARQANQRLVQGKKVRLEKDVSDMDKYGRLLRYVYVNSTFVNAELVRQGYARAHAYPPDTKYQFYLEAAEREARQEGKGIWQQK